MKLKIQILLIFITVYNLFALRTLEKIFSRGNNDQVNYYFEIRGKKSKYSFKNKNKNTYSLKIYNCQLSPSLKNNLKNISIIPRKDKHLQINLSFPESIKVKDSFFKKENMLRIQISAFISEEIIKKEENKTKKNINNKIKNYSIIDKYCLALDLEKKAGLDKEKLTQVAILLEEVIQDSNDFKKARVDIARIYRSLGNQKKAEEHYSKLFSKKIEQKPPKESSSQLSKIIDEKFLTSDNFLIYLIAILAILIIILTIFYLILKKRDAKKEDQRIADILENKLEDKAETPSQTVAKDAKSEEKELAQKKRESQLSQILDIDPEKELSINENIREKIIELFDDGYSNKEISEGLKISKDEVDFVVKSIGEVDNAQSASYLETENNLEEEEVKPLNDKEKKQPLTSLPPKANPKEDQDLEEKLVAIKELASLGKTKKEIAQELNLGIDEITLMINLYKIELKDPENSPELEEITPPETKASDPFETFEKSEDDGTSDQDYIDSKNNLEEKEALPNDEEELSPDDEETKSEKTGQQEAIAEIAQDENSELEKSISEGPDLEEKIINENFSQETPGLKNDLAEENLAANPSPVKEEEIKEEVVEEENSQEEITATKNNIEQAEKPEIDKTISFEELNFDTAYNELDEIVNSNLSSQEENLELDLIPENEELDTMKKIYQMLDEFKTIEEIAKLTNLSEEEINLYKKIKEGRV